MSDYVYSANDGMVANHDGGTVFMKPGDVWFADDPFVLARPDLFQATPPIVKSTVGRLPAAEAPIAAPRRGRARV